MPVIFTIRARSVENINPPAICMIIIGIKIVKLLTAYSKSRKATALRVFSGA